MLMSGCGINNLGKNAETSGDIIKAFCIVLSECIFEEAPFAQCHASIIAETKDGLAAAWFGGTRESEPDVSIRVSRRGRNGWSPVEKVADGSELSGRRCIIQ
jgi:predicted neuraminidase